MKYQNIDTFSELISENLTLFPSLGSILHLPPISHILAYYLSITPKRYSLKQYTFFLKALQRIIFQ